MKDKTKVSGAKIRGESLQVPEEPIEEVIEEQVLPTGVTKTSEETDDYNVEIIRDFDGKIDPFYLEKKNPEYAYRFLRYEPKNLSMKTSNLLFQHGGWQLVPKGHLLKLGIKDRELSPEGFLMRGDCVLAFMPMKLFKEKELHKQKEADGPMKAVKRMLKEGDKSVGGTDMHPSMKGIQTAEALGMK